MLIVPFLGCLFIAYQSYSMTIRLSFSHQSDKRLLIQLVWPAFTYVFFGVVAIILHKMEKYLENSVMCTTLIASFIVSYAMSMIINLVFLWSK